MTKINFSHIRTKYQKGLDQLQYVLDLLRTDVRILDRRVALLTYCSIYEQNYACLHLINGHGFNILPIILRVILEAQIDLANLMDDKKGNEYVKILLANYLKQEKKFLKNQVDRFSGKLNDQEKETERKYIKVKAKLRELKEGNNINPISIYEQFKMAGCEEVYENQYARLCLDTHNDLSIIDKKHLTLKSDNISFEIFKERDQYHKKAYTTMLIGSIILSTDMILEKFQINKDEQIVQIRNQLLDLQNEIDNSQIFEDL